MGNHTQIMISIFLAIFGTIFCGLVAKIVWDWLSRKGKVPLALNGFLTLTQVQQHCKDQHAIYMELAKSHFKVVQIEIQGRLERGDKQFEAIETRFTGIDAKLDTQANCLTDIKNLIINGGGS